MTNAKHTLGPWKLEDANLDSGPKLTMIIAHGFPVAKALDNCDSVEETEANAQLIAAAPELLAALIRMEEAERKQRAGETYDYSNAILEARAAIAKATGGA